MHSSVLVDESILLLLDIGNRFDGQWCKILFVAMLSSLQIEAADEDTFDESIIVYLIILQYILYIQDPDII